MSVLAAILHAYYINCCLMEKKKESAKSQWNQHDETEDLTRNGNMSRDFDTIGTIKVTGKIDHNNTLTNLLMYESEYIPRRSFEDIHPAQIEENGNAGMSDSDESEDFLYNFLLKLVNALAYRIRILERGCFESILTYSPSKQEPINHMKPLDSSSDQRENGEPLDQLNPIQEQSESSESKRQSVITFSSQHEVGRNSSEQRKLTFNSNLKKKPRQICQTSQSKPVKLELSIPSMKNNILLALREKPGFENRNYNQLAQTQSLKPHINNRESDFIQPELIDETVSPVSPLQFPARPTYSKERSIDPLLAANINQSLNTVKSTSPMASIDQTAPLKSNPYRPISSSLDTLHRTQKIQARPVTNYPSPYMAEHNPQRGQFIMGEQMPARGQFIMNSASVSKPVSRTSDQDVHVARNGHQKVFISYETKSTLPQRPRSENPRQYTPVKFNYIPSQYHPQPQQEGMIKIVRSQYYATEDMKPHKDRIPSHHQNAYNPQSIRSAPSSPMVSRDFHSPQHFIANNASPGSFLLKARSPHPNHMPGPPHWPPLPSHHHAQTKKPVESARFLLRSPTEPSTLPDRADEARFLLRSPTEPNISSAQSAPMPPNPAYFSQKSISPIEGLVSIQERERKEMQRARSPSIEDRNNPVFREFHDNEYFDESRPRSKRKINVLSPRHLPRK